MRRPLRHSSRLVKGAIAGGLSLTLGAGAAWAYFTATGSGTGSGSTGTLQAVTGTAFLTGDSPNGAMVPGGSADIIARLSNPNPFAVELVSISPGAVTVDANHSAACPGTSVTFTTPTNLPVTLAAGASLYHFNGAATMSISAPTGCQGATFTIPFSSFQVQK